MIFNRNKTMTQEQKKKIINLVDRKIGTTENENKVVYDYISKGYFDYKVSCGDYDNVVDTMVKMVIGMRCKQVV